MEAWRAREALPMEWGKTMEGDAFVFEEAFNVLCGSLIGEGTYRKVFQCTLDPALVVKVERDPHNFMNVHEWRNWELLREWSGSSWLAPCRMISPRGTILIQERAISIYPEDMPDKVPSFLSDLKWENFGRINGRIVCRDYGFVVTNASLRLKKANWR